MPAQEIPATIFRAYDIRGIVGNGLDAGVMEQIGRAVASEALDRGETALVVGRDARLSSPDFAAAMITGIRATGCHAIDIGTVPTPLLYFATHTLDARSGVMITGSHNPRDYNGVKIVLDRKCLAANRITRLRERIVHNALHRGRGGLTRADVGQAYIEAVGQRIAPARSHKVVIDCGNGVAGTCAPALFTALGCEVLPLYCEPDGNFPNHHPDPTRAENLTDLVARVKREGAALGIAFDGDGDRVALVSHDGGIINADRMMTAYINDILPGNPGARIIFDVKSSKLLPELIRRLGGEPVMCKSGHSYVKQAMEKTGALLGGEFSAHIFFRHRWFGFDDGMYTAARFLELMDKNGKDAQALLAAFPEMVSTPEIRVPVSEAGKFDIMRDLQAHFRIDHARLNTLDGIRADMDHGWGLVRASNTTPCLVLRFEADSTGALEDIKRQFREAIGARYPDLPLAF